MTVDQWSDEDIARLTSGEREHLIRRLEAATGSPPLRPPMRGYIRQVRLGLMVVGAAVLIPWTAYLAATLPVDYSAHNWDATWVGFDSALVVLLTTTVALALMRRRLVMATAFATGILLICDAWFDVMTAAPADRPEALAAAALLELPVAVLLIQAAWRVFRLDREEPAIFGH